MLSVRIGEMVQREIEMEFTQICYWTDSEIVLKYIQNESKQYTVYVGNRVMEIREKSQLSQWRYCPSKENPSDDASRGLNPVNLTSECRWLNGPSFLKKAESTWPISLFGELSSNDPEVIQSTVQRGTIHFRSVVPKIFHMDATSNKNCVADKIKKSC